VSTVLSGVSSFLGSAWKDSGGVDGCSDWCGVDMVWEWEDVVEFEFLG